MFFSILIYLLYSEYKLYQQEYMKAILSYFKGNYQEIRVIYYLINPQFFHLHIVNV